MPSIIFIASNGGQTVADGEIGQSVMEVARRHGIPGILAECGGSRACATCHVHVAREWKEAVGPAGHDEADMLAFAFEPTPDSRLSCQIRLRSDLDGLIVRLPTRQR